MGIFGRKKEDRHEEIINNEIGEEIHVIKGEYGTMGIKKLNMSDFLYSGEAWCPDCHSKCVHKESYWECPICFYSITDEELEEGEGYPTRESTYEDDYGYFNDNEDDDDF